MTTFNKQTKIEIYEMYSNNMGTVKISKILHTSPRKIKEVLLEMGVDIHSPNKPIGKKIKPIGYWKIKRNNSYAASQCRNRREFSKKFLTAYKVARSTGWIFEYDALYFTGETKYVSFDEPVHVVYAYEVVETNSVYIGRTLDMKRENGCFDTLEKCIEAAGIIHR